MFDDSTQNESLTPNHLLLVRETVNLPPGLFSKKDCYTRRRWAQVQFFSNQFWCRWVNEFMPNLTQRQKWFQPGRNVQVGDVMLLAESMQQRSKWVMGKVLETYPDKNGKVRIVLLKTPGSTMKRPIAKLCVILSESAIVNSCISFCVTVFCSVKTVSCAKRPLLNILSYCVLPICKLRCFHVVYTANHDCLRLL